MFIHCCSCRFSISYIICLSFFLESIILFFMKSETLLKCSVTNDCIQFLLTFYAVCQLFQNWACLLFVPFNKRKIQLILDKTKIPMSLVIVEFIFCSSAMSEIFFDNSHVISWSPFDCDKVGSDDINTKWAILCLCCFLSSYDPNCSQNPYCSSVR